MSKDFTTMTVDQAIEVVVTKYKFKDVRTRIQSKAAAWILYTALTEAAGYIHQLEQRIAKLENKDGEQ